MKTQADRIATAVKLKALAERGERGEKHAAKIAYETYLKRYGITEADFEAIEPRPHIFTFGSDANQMLAAQIVYHVTGQNLLKRVSNTNFSTICTPIQANEIQEKWDFYWQHYQTELQLFTEAFINVHNLFNATPAQEPTTSVPDDAPPPPEPTAEEIHARQVANSVKQQRIQIMMQTIRRKLFLRQLPQNTTLKIKD